MRIIFFSLPWREGTKSRGIRLTRIHGYSWNERTIYPSNRDSSCPSSSPIKADFQCAIGHNCIVCHCDTPTGPTRFIHNVEIFFHQLSLQQFLMVMLLLGLLLGLAFLNFEQHQCHTDRKIKWWITWKQYLPIRITHKIEHASSIHS